MQRIDVPSGRVSLASNNNQDDNDEYENNHDHPPYPDTWKLAWSGRRTLRKQIPVLVSILVAMIIWFWPSQQLSSAAMHLFGVFTGVILALLLTDYSISMIAVVGMIVLAWTQSLRCVTKDGLYVDCNLCGTEIPDDSSHQLYRCDPYADGFRTALSGFSNDVNWLVFAAFHIGKAVEITKLGHRLSLWMIRLLGRSYLGLGYAIYLSEIILGPFIPSNTARGGGIVMPIALSLSRTLDRDGSMNIAEYLMMCGAHANLLSASFYQTGMAANPLVSREAERVFSIDFSFLKWTLGASLPGLISFAVSPWLLYHLVFRRVFNSIFLRKMKRKLSDQTRRATVSSSEAHHRATISFDHQLLSENDSFVDDEFETEENELQPCAISPRSHLHEIRSQVDADLCVMGSMRQQEYILIAILFGCFSLWITKSWTGFDTTLVAFTAIVVMLLTGVLTWEQVVTNYKAWETFFWLGLLIMMANQLSSLGVAKMLGESVGKLIEQMGAGPTGSAMILSLIYFYMMYIFSSLTGHIVAFVGPFMDAAKSLHASPWLVTCLLAYFSSLCGCLTNYSSGPIVLYFSQGFSSRGFWFAIGFIVSVLYMLVYFSAGLLWWKILGWW